MNESLIGQIDGTGGSRDNGEGDSAYSVSDRERTMHPLFSQVEAVMIPVRSCKVEQCCPLFALLTPVRSTESDSALVEV